MKTIEEIKSELLLKNSIRKGGEEKKVPSGLEGVPVKKIYDSAQHLENVLLPLIEKTRGKDHADYKFFAGVLDSLIWCIAVIDRFEFLKRSDTYRRIENELLRSHVALCERELLRYTTIEDLFLTDALDRYAATVKEYIANKLNSGK